MAENKNKVLYSGNLAIEYGQFYIDITDEDNDDYIDPVEAFKGQENGICGAAQKGRLFFVAGIQDGVIAIDVELHTDEPVVDQSYEEIVEVPFQHEGSPVSLCEWGHEATHELGLPSGNYRVRYCIDGMEKDYDDDDDDEDWEAPVPGQRYLIQIWSADPKQDQIIKHTSETARYWHKQWGRLE